MKPCDVITDPYFNVQRRLQLERGRAIASNEWKAVDVMIAHAACHSLSWTILVHDDVIKLKHFPRYWPFVRGIYRSPGNSPHKGQWGMFSLLCALNKRLSEQSRGWWFETPSHSLWRHCNEIANSPHYEFNSPHPSQISLQIFQNIALLLSWMT